MTVVLFSVMAKNSKEAALDKRLIEVYKQYGLERFLEVCSGLLDIRDSADFEKKKKVNGEVCEVVLRVLTKHYFNVMSLKGGVFGSVILNDHDNPKSSFCTELDSVILTPRFCLTGECKSYVGDISVVGDCTLVRGDFSTDVARQSKLHGTYLRKYLRDYATPAAGASTPPFGLFCFVYSNGRIRDTRNSTKKQEIPILTIKNLFTYYDKLLNRYKKEVIDYERAAKFFSESSASKALHEKHRAFVGY